LGFIIRYDISLALFGFFNFHFAALSARSYGLTRASNGDMYLVGDYQGSFTIFDREYTGTKSNTQHLSSAGSDMFVVKMNSTGGLIWVKSIGGASTDYARDVAVSNDYVFVSGSFSGITTFGTSTLTARTSGDGVWVRVNPTTGAVIDALSGGGASPSSDEADSVVFSSIGDALYSTINVFGPSVQIGQGSQNPLVYAPEDSDFAFISFTACTPIASPCVAAHSISTVLTCSLAETKCNCIAGYSGDFCEINTNECASNPCKHGGTCVDGIASYTCTCLTGYTGSNCETDNFDECASSPCMNGASCVAPFNQDLFNCTCRAGFVGTWCQTNINDCSSSPCLNGGLCVDGENLYTCTCVNGFSGTNCKDTESSVFAIGAVAGGVAAAVAFLILSLICYFKCCRKEDNKMASATPKAADTPANTGVI